MKKFINNPDYVVEDMVNGFVKAYDYIVRSEKNDHVVKYKCAPIDGKVGMVSGGGSGHEPAFIGYVGKNMLDAVAIGEVFSSPPAQVFYDAFMEADSGCGVVCLFGNYAGDNMNVKMAIQMAEEEGVEVHYVCANDDIASSPKDSKEKRHGIAGGVNMWKVGCAMASSGGSIKEILRVSQKVVDETRSICVGLDPCIIPAVGKSNFMIDTEMLEFGIGHHGEAGIKVEKLKSADLIAKEMIQAIWDDLELKEQDEVCVIVSGLGATPIMEQYIMFDTFSTFLSERGVQKFQPLVGNYVTSLDMNGIALTITRVDEELKQLLSSSVESPGLTRV